jgi:hypothetical protein
VDLVHGGSDRVPTVAVSDRVPTPSMGLKSDDPSCRSPLLVLLAAAMVPVHSLVDVRAFGAAGNGAADDTAAVQAAIDNVTLSGGV